MSLPLISQLFTLSFETIKFCANAFSMPMPISSTIPLLDHHTNPFKSFHVHRPEPRIQEEFAQELQPAQNRFAVSIHIDAEFNPD